MTAVKHSSLALYGKLEGAVLVESNGDYSRCIPPSLESQKIGQQGTGRRWAVSIA